MTIRHALAGAALLLAPALAVNAGTLQINGAGATFPYPIYSKWFSEYNKLHPEIQINYQSIGSGGGIRQLTDETVFFGASDGPMTQDQLLAARGPVLHFPTVLGAVVPAYTLPGVKGEIKFTGKVLADIFLGTITDWSDPAIASLNPDMTLPSMPITVVHRADGSGTTYIWCDYLSKMSPEYKKTVGVATSVKWPAGVGGKGNEGVAGLVKATPGALGYVELIYARQNDIAYGSVQNQAGEFVTASLESVTAAAAATVKTIPADFRVSITNAAGTGVYPISSYTWFLLWQNPHEQVERAKAMVDFVKWALTDGQSFAKDLGYAPLPAEVVDLEMKALGKIEEPAPTIDPMSTRPSRRVSDAAFRLGTGIFALVVLVLVAAIAIELARTSRLSIAKFGLGFWTGTDWDPVAGEFGALPFLWGTLYSSAIALTIAAPIAIGIAIFLSELCPRRLLRPLAFLTELLAAIPSIVYGLWGLFVLVPIIRKLELALPPSLRKNPFFAGPPLGVGMLAAALVLAIMVIPFISAVAREMLRAVPRGQRESALALGATRWEAICVVLRGARGGLLGAVTLGLGRALGETMAVAMVIGNSPQITLSLTKPQYTMAAVLANEFTEAGDNLYLSALLEVGLLLMIVTLVVNALSRLLIWASTRGPREAHVAQPAEAAT